MTTSKASSKEIAPNIPCAQCGYDPTRTVLYEVELLIPFKILSGNMLMTGNRKGAKRYKSGWKYRSYKEGFRKAYSNFALKVLPAENKRRVEITRVKGKNAQPIDPDNLALGCKPLYDILQEFEAIVNDNPNWCERGTPTEEKSSDGKHYTRIRIVEYEDDGREN